MLDFALGRQQRSDVADVALAHAVANDQAVGQCLGRSLLCAWGAAGAGCQLAAIASHRGAAVRVETVAAALVGANMRGRCGVISRRTGAHLRGVDAAQRPSEQQQLQSHCDCVQSLTFD